MSAQPDHHDVIHLGGQEAVIVPIGEYRMLSALRDHASEEARELAALDAAIPEFEAWEAAGRPGGTIPHEEVMAELLGGGG